MNVIKKLKQNLLRYSCNGYLLWFDEVSTKTALPPSHFIWILWCVKSHYFKLLYFYIGLSLAIAVITDIILKDKSRTKKLSDFLKKHSSPELFQIFGNPGEAAAAKLAGKALGSKTAMALGTSVAIAGGVDHVMTHTGVYDSISYKVNTAAGMSEETAIARLPERNSALDHILKKSPNELELERLKNEIEKLKNDK